MNSPSYMLPFFNYVEPKTAKTSKKKKKKKVGGNERDEKNIVMSLQYVEIQIYGDNWR